MAVEGQCGWMRVDGDLGWMNVDVDGCSNRNKEREERDENKERKQDNNGCYEAKKRMEGNKWTQI